MRLRLLPRKAWIVTVAALFMAVLTFALGQWQLSRAAQKIALHGAMIQRESLPALDGRKLDQPLNMAELVHRRIMLSGQWDAAHTVYLDNRPMEGRPGFWVMTPLRIDGSARSVLVQRGWIPRNFQDRTELAPVDTPAGSVQVVGRIAPAPGKLYEFQGATVGLIRQNLDIAAFAAETGLPLHPLLVVQTSPASEGLRRDWAPVEAGVEKHYGYAFQWFSLCALIVGLYAWFQWIAPRRRASHTQPNNPADKP
ncbi:MAG: SURF1 family protein [Pseudomonadota bacterium]